LLNDIRAVGYNKCTHQVMTAGNHAKSRNGEYGSGDADGGSKGK
jgi:hypothetical protein